MMICLIVILAVLCVYGLIMNRQHKQLKKCIAWCVFPSNREIGRDQSNAELFYAEQVNAEIDEEYRLHLTSPSPDAALLNKAVDRCCTRMMKSYFGGGYPVKFSLKEPDRELFFWNMIFDRLQTEVDDMYSEVYCDRLSNGNGQLQVRLSDYGTVCYKAQLIALTALKMRGQSVSEQLVTNTMREIKAGEVQFSRMSFADSLFNSR